ncbi:tRNA (adenosine(37)-N6)-dimethylallyltransferase MiaA [Candidatus Woesebacteria bacterium]|nr:tRNA (adenosine(37)-N6)-dimethylallyltransferase MiaA [Candidatus Woesebacteria bacterium]
MHSPSQSSDIYFILGQTATGKTARAVGLARENSGELVNCDSRQIYQGLDIITGKTDNPVDIPMHLVDVREPDVSYSAYDFAKEATQHIQEIISRYKTPIIVGGTGLYARVLLHADPNVQELIELSPVDSGLNNLTVDELQQKLITLNSSLFAKLTPSDKLNPRRLIRAIQKIEHGHTNLIALDSPNTIKNQHNVNITILLHENQEILRSRISTRVDERLSLGAVDECKALLAAGYKQTDPGLATLGYQSIFRYLEGQSSFEAMRSEWITKECQYAKRQKTYLLKYFEEAHIHSV